MELELYRALRQEIEQKLGDRIKHVRLFNNQFVRSNDEGKEHAFNYPCVFLEFSNSNFSDYLKGVQKCDITVTTHLGFESYKDEDEYVLQLKQDLYNVVQRFRNGYYDKLTRKYERIDLDHDNIQVYITEYTTSGKDFEKDTRPTREITLSVNADVSIQLSGLTN